MRKELLTLSDQAFDALTVFRVGKLKFYCTYRRMERTQTMIKNLEKSSSLNPCDLQCSGSLTNEQAVWPLNTEVRKPKKVMTFILDLQMLHGVNLQELLTLMLHKCITL